MKPELEVLGISIKTFGVAFALGFLACGALVARRLRELGRPVDWAYEITFAAAIGRIGCQVSGDGDYGIRSTLPTSMGYPHGTVPTPPGVTVLPTPIYETVLMCLLAWGLWQLRDRLRPGVVFALYLIGSGFERL